MAPYVQQLRLSVCISRVAEFALATALLLYALAVGLGHVPAWLPEISDCSHRAPEKFVFRFGLILSAAGILACVGPVYAVVARPAERQGRALLAARCEQVAAVCLAVVGACSPWESLPTHATAAVLYFTFQGASMVLITSCLRIADDPAYRGLLVTRIALIVVYCLAFAALGLSNQASPTTPI